MRNSNKNLLIIIAVLLLTNIAVLGYFLWYKKTDVPVRNDRDRNGIADMLQKEVGFTDAQVAEYKILKEKQRGTIRPMFDDMRKSKDSLFKLLGVSGLSDSTLNSITDGIAHKQKLLEIETFQHFKRVRALCTPEQEAKYDSMIVRMFRKMGKPSKPGEKK